MATDFGRRAERGILLGTPCVTLRDETEWPETTQGGWNIIAGTRTEAILDALARPRPHEPRLSPFGTGDTSERIAQTLRARFLSHRTFPTTKAAFHDHLRGIDGTEPRRASDTARVPARDGAIAARCARAAGGLLPGRGRL